VEDGKNGFLLDSAAGLPDGIFQTKNPDWVNFGGSRNGSYWYILWSFGLFYCHLVYVFCDHLVHVGIFCGHLVYFVVIWYILWSFGIFCGHLVYFVVIWYILWSFGIFYGDLVHLFVPVLVCYTKKNLATLFCSRVRKVTNSWRFNVAQANAIHFRFLFFSVPPDLTPCSNDSKRRVKRNIT
jgi:hypothetical protein